MLTDIHRDQEIRKTTGYIQCHEEDHGVVACFGSQAPLEFVPDSVEGDGRGVQVEMGGEPDVGSVGVEDGVIGMGAAAGFGDGGFKG